MTVKFGKATFDRLKPEEKAVWEYMGFSWGADDASKLKAIREYLKCERLGLWPTLNSIRTFVDDEGHISAVRLLQAAKDVQKRHKAALANGAKRAEAERVAGLSIQERIKHEAQKKKYAKDEEDRRRQAYMDATRKEAEEEAAKFKQKQEEEKQKRIEKEKRRKFALKQWKREEKARRASAEAERKAKADAAKRAEAQRAAWVKKVINDIANILSEGDARTASLKRLTRAATPDEKRQIVKELDQLETRAFLLKSKWRTR
jgi:hypothetical protein